MSRSRSRIPVKATHGIGNTLIASMDFHKERITESSFPGSCSVEHVKHKKLVSLIRSDGAYWYDYPMAALPIPGPDRLNWGKIPSSSQFGLIQFFAELDDTLLLFTKRFWSQLNYGSFTWGVLPFLNEVQSLVKTVDYLGRNISAFDYEDEYTRTIPVKDYIPTPGWSYSGTIQARYRLTGKADISFQHPGSILLDRLGFHPDLSTAWDLVPLSFVVDWLLPIGDYLESLRGGGWVKTAFFTGWQTVKADISAVATHTELDRPTSDCSYTVFSRTPSSIPLFVPQTPDKVPDLKLPNFRQLFNMIYLAGLGRKLNI